MLVAGLALVFRELMKRKWLRAVHLDNKLFCMAWDQKRVEDGVHTTMDALRIYEEQTLRRIEMSNLQTVQTSCSQNFDPSGFISEADGAGASPPDLEAAAQYVHASRGNRRPLFIEHNSPMLRVCSWLFFSASFA
jgi:hypothetical protein